MLNNLNSLSAADKNAGTNPSAEFAEKFDVQTREYFNSLPKFIQESIMQSSAVITNRQELETIAKNISDAKALE